MKIRFRLLIVLFVFTIYTNGQVSKDSFNHQDSVRGSITKERKWWDLKYYNLFIKVDPDKKSISGTNEIHYKVIKPDNVLQIDLQEPMIITRIEQNRKPLNFCKEGNAWYIKLEEKQKKNMHFTIIVHFEGRPVISKNPPWDGGLTWTKDSKGILFAATTCQGDGASLWWPCKDHMYDEPDSMSISITVPKNLIAVSNGKLRETVDNLDSTHTFKWFVSNPINNYSVNMNIGNYTGFSEKYEGLNGLLECTYYVLPENIEKAKEQFKQVQLMLKAFEYWFGKYPFYADGYKLVEVPYLGMEHQSSVTYGNNYTNGYKGYDLSGSGWGNTFDFIIIHESGHEWFGNSISYKDIADMWIHESFTAYAEGLFVEYFNGKKAGAEYTTGTRMNILNDKPIIGKYDVNHAGSGDMYYKGANMLHMIRQLVNNDQKWHAILVQLNKTFYHQVVDTRQIEKFLAKKTGLKLKPFFDQYLRDVRIPEFQYFVENNTLHFRWDNCVREFSMPLRILINDRETWIYPNYRWKKIKMNTPNLLIQVDPNFYILVKNICNPGNF